jgi:2-oxoisovalerate dehydrogenase E2 component (dihydrolipoyl transacylase)
MATEIKMPQLGESVTEGTVGKWLKQPGERVEKYEALLEVTTDKVDTEVPSPIGGVVREIAVPEGTTVRVGTLLAVLDDDGAQSAALRQAPLRQAQEPEPRRAQSDGAQASNDDGLRSNARTLERSNAFISPVVARLAAEHNLDLGNISGTGQGGRVTKQDVLKYIESRGKSQPSGAKATGEIGDTRLAVAPTMMPPMATPLPARTSAGPAPQAAEPVERAFPEDAEIIPISPMRRSIAEHMVRSRRTAPHVTTVFEVDVSRIVAHREGRQADFERQGVKLTYTPYFVQAVVAGLQAVPVVNGSYGESGIVMNRRIQIGVAVALEEGLIVPVIRDADEKNLLGLSRAVNDLSERARSHRLKPDETQGGTFTITNHGVSGSLFATPIINQPQAAILGVGAIQKRAVVISQGGVDAIAIRPMCYLSLTIDHRMLDGATADRFLTAVKEFLEGYAE